MSEATAAELEVLQADLDRDRARRQATGFDPAAAFLLGLRFDNLFEPAGRDTMRWRCKGCGAEVKHGDREAHYEAHRKERVDSSAERAYPDTANTGNDLPNEGDEEMATATRTRSSRKAAEATPAAATKKATQAAAKVAAASKPAAEKNSFDAKALHASLVKGIAAIKGVSRTSTKSYVRFSLGNKTLASVRELPKRGGHVQVSMPNPNGPGSQEHRASSPAEGEKLLKTIQARAEAMGKK